MPFVMLKAPTRLLTLLCAMLCLPACVSAPPIVSTQSACSKLLPPEWEGGVEGAPLPEGLTVADLAAFGDAQTGQLDKSNDRYRAATGIMARCEEWVRRGVERSRPRFFGIF